MKITVSKIKRELVENYGWASMPINSDANQRLINEIIKDTLKIVNKLLIEKTKEEAEEVVKQFYNKQK